MRLSAAGRSADVCRGLSAWSRLQCGWFDRSSSRRRPACKPPCDAAPVDESRCRIITELRQLNEQSPLAGAGTVGISAVQLAPDCTRLCFATGLLQPTGLRDGVAETYWVLLLLMPVYSVTGKCGGGRRIAVGDNGKHSEQQPKGVKNDVIGY